MGYPFNLKLCDLLIQAHEYQILYPPMIMIMAMMMLSNSKRFHLKLSQYGLQCICILFSSPIRHTCSVHVSSKILMRIYTFIV